MKIKISQIIQSKILAQSILSACTDLISTIDSDSNEAEIEVHPAIANLIIGFTSESNGHVQTNSRVVKEMKFRNAIVCVGSTLNSYIIKKNSKIARITSSACPANVVIAREKLFSKGDVSKEGLCLHDIYIEGSRSLVAGIIAGSTCNGKLIFQNLGN